jgi:hypothetical protein
MIDNFVTDLWAALTARLAAVWDWAAAHPLLTLAIAVASVTLVWLAERAIVHARTRKRS